MYYLINFLDKRASMNRCIIKIIIIKSLLLGGLIGMEPQPRNRNWRCGKHTRSQDELFKLGLLETALGFSLAYIGLKDDLTNYLFASNQDTTSGVMVVDENRAQRFLIPGKGRKTDNVYALAFSISLLCEACDSLRKSLYYEEYVNQRHATHNCLTNHQ